MADPDDAAEKPPPAASPPAPDTPVTGLSRVVLPSLPPAPVRPRRRHGPLRRADLAALLVGVATIGYTVFALLQPAARQDTSEAPPRDRTAAVDTRRGVTDRTDGTDRTGSGDPGTGSATSASPTSTSPTSLVGIPDGIDLLTGPSASAVAPGGDPDDGADATGTTRPRSHPTPTSARPSRATGRPPANGAPADRNSRSSSEAAGRATEGSAPPRRPGPARASTPERGAPTTAPTSRPSQDQAPPTRRPPAAGAPAPAQIAPTPATTTQAPTAKVTTTTATAASVNRPAPTTATSRPATSTPPTLPSVSVPCSRISLLPAMVTFVNTTSVPLTLEYSSYTCRRRSFGAVPPGGRMSVPTWVNHVWAFTDPTTGRAVAAHVVRVGDRVVTMP